jgi:hypothetical protein
MMTLLKANGTDVFVTNGYWGTQPPFLGGNREITNADTLAGWVEVQLTGLNQWINVKGFTNIKQWTVTNEFNSFDAFDATRRANWFRHARSVHNGLAGRNLAGKVEVTGTDALGRVDAWRATLPDAVNFHNDLFGRYEVHDYPQTNYYLQDANGNWLTGPNRSPGNFYFDTSGGASNDGDNSVAVRHNLSTESIVYNKPNITDVSVKLIYHTTFPATVKYYTSPDNSTYTLQAMLLSSSPTAGGYYRYTYVPGGALPAGTNYFKIEISGGSQAWATRVSEVNLKHSPAATARIAAARPEAAGAETLSVFPNPAAGDVTVVYYAAAEGEVSLSVADALGRPHLTRQLKARSGVNRETLRMGTLKRGLYTIQMRSLTGTPRTVKVLLTH